MRNFSPFKIALLIISLSLLCTSCFDPPDPDFVGYPTTITAGESVTFTDLTLNEPSSLAWTFNGGAPSNSTSLSPEVTYNTAGTYDVILEATNRGGTEQEYKPGYITVLLPATDITFNNPTYTDIEIEVESEWKTIPSGGSVTYYGVEGESVDYYAYTSGETSSGTQIGLLIYWDYTITLEGGTLDYTLNIGEDKYFLYITNSGTHNFYKLVVEQGVDDTRTENITIPNNGTKYSIGYYYAWEDTEVKGYWEDDPDWYTVFSNLSFPGTINQQKHLIFTLKKGTSVQSGQGTIDTGIPGELMPASEINILKTQKEGTIVHFPSN